MRENKKEWFKSHGPFIVQINVLLIVCNCVLFIYRDNLESKQKEQADLKVEMEKMSELISDLRSNCQTLQHELSEVRAISKDRIDVAIQANVDNSRPSTRRLSNSSITQVR